MRIGVNLLSLTNDRFGGVEQYVTNLISQLLTMDKNIKLFLFLTRPCRDLFPDYQDRLKKLMIKEYKVHDSIYPLIAECQLDLWFSPIHKSYIPNVPVPSIATIHDVLHTAYPQFVHGGLIDNNRYYQHFASSFDAVLTVSSFQEMLLQRTFTSQRKNLCSISRCSNGVPQFPTDVLKEKIKKNTHLKKDTRSTLPAIIHIKITSACLKHLLFSEIPLKSVYL